MRDVVVLALVLIGSGYALKKPWIGIILWSWLSIMNPHRYTWGFAYDAPVAAIAAGATLLGLLMTKERESPFKGSPVVWFTLFVVWINLSWLLGLDVAGDYPQWNKVMKIDLMILVALALLRTKEHIFALTWVVIGSLGLLGVKGGIFTIVTGGGNHVWGPPGSFIEDNNEFALAMVMTIPMLRFLQIQAQAKWLKLGLLVAMVLCAAAALGSQSRGALLAILAMATVLWWRSKSRVLGGVLILLIGIELITFMPETWSERMATIEHYQQDRSAMGRISAWWAAWNIAKTYVFGVGFNPATPALFARFSPYPDFVHAAHSIYFQVLGNHGFVGLILFLGLWFTTWRWAGWLRKEGAKQPETKWCAELGAMSQVTMVGYAVGGAFLSLAYFDLPYNIMIMIVLTRVWVATRAWEREPEVPKRWWTLPGLASRPAGTA